MKHCLVFASLISPSKMILFEKKYQTFDTVFHHQMKHLEVRQKYSAARRIFNSLLGVSSGDETLHLMFDILLENALNTNKRSTTQTNGNIMKFVQSEVHALLIINIALFLLIYKRQLTYAVLVVLTSIAHCIGTVHGPVTHSYYPGTLCTIFWSTSLLNIS